MKVVTAIGKYVICIIKKEEPKKNGHPILIIPNEEKPKIYTVYHAGSSDILKDNDQVYLTGYAQPLEIGSETYYIVLHDHIGAIIHV